MIELAAAALSLRYASLCRLRVLGSGCCVVFGDTQVDLHGFDELVSIPAVRLFDVVFID